MASCGRARRISMLKGAISRLSAKPPPGKSDRRLCLAPLIGSVENPRFLLRHHSLSLLESAAHLGSFQKGGALADHCNRLPVGYPCSSIKENTTDRGRSVRASWRIGRRRGPRAGIVRGDRARKIAHAARFASLLRTPPTGPATCKDSTGIPAMPGKVAEFACWHAIRCGTSPIPQCCASRRPH